MPKTEGSVKENTRKARKKGKKKNGNCKGSRPSMTSKDKQLRIDFSGAGDSLGPQAWGGGGFRDFSSRDTKNTEPGAAATHFKRISMTEAIACIYRYSTGATIARSVKRK